MRAWATTLSLLASTLAVAAAGCELRSNVLASQDGSATDATVTRPPLDASQLAMSRNHLCVLRSDGRLECAGPNARFQLGRADGLPQLYLAPTDAALRFVEVAAAIRFTCGRDEEGDVFCFGDNAEHQLGRDDVTATATPARVPLPGSAVEIDAYYQSACAIVVGGSLFCWGLNIENQVAPDAVARHAVPQLIAPGVAFEAVAIGEGHVCAIEVGGQLWCWGRNTGGELGLGTLEPPRLPDPTPIGTERWRAIDAGASYTCAVRADGTLYCWGLDEGGVGLPAGETVVRYPTPQRIDDATDWSEVVVDSFHSCGLRAGALYCWGRNDEGQLALGDESAVAEAPTLVDHGPFVDLALSRFATCVLRADASGACAGLGNEGELANGTTGRYASLVPIVPRPPD